MPRASIEKILEAVSNGCGDHAGCNDGDEARTKDWIALANSENPADHEQLYAALQQSAAYGG